ncbi:MAG: hypothetical protein LBI72_05425 [Flavobacteriaceae bacterium]|nr:hypothetical protein [Flavobacteriaceae bacterium]
MKGGTNITVGEVKEGNSIKYTLNVPTATTDVAGVVKVGEGLNIDGSGNVTVNYETAKEKLATGNVTSTSITVIGGDKSTFKNVALEITPGKQGQVMVTGADDKTTWVDQSTIVPVTSNEIKADGTDIVSTVNGEGSKLTLVGDVVLKGGKTVVNAIQDTPVSETKPTTDGQALVFVNGQWIPGTPKVDVTNVTDAKNFNAADGDNATIEVVSGGLKAVLVETSIRVKQESITSNEIKNGTIQPEDIAKAGNNQVLVTGADGVPTWKNQAEVGEIVTANNGLTKVDSKIQLGGALIKSTVINTDNANTLALTGLDKKKTQGISATEGITQHLLAVDKNGDVIKALKAAMPKFFYMPSVMVPTAESQATQAGVSYNNVDRKGTIDMYAIYKKQFGTPVMSSPGASVLPVLPASELGFHVTYATEGVFKILSIDANGLMTYEVSATANVNVGSFINIVFSVKEDN